MKKTEIFFLSLVLMCSACGGVTLSGSEGEKKEASVTLAVRAVSLEAAIRAFGAQFSGYPAAALLKRIEDVRKTGDAAAFDVLMREALVRKNPLFGGEICYVTRSQYAGDHHNTATMFQPGEINERSYRTQGALKALDPATGAVRVIVPEVPHRTVRDPEVDAAGKQIVFAMRTGRADSYHLFTVQTDGSGLRQLTRAKDVTDIDPAWLPDGGIVFTSTRDPKYCMCNRHIMGNLYRMDADGGNIHQIGTSTLHEGHATVLSDGRVLYDRWEYVDRNFGDAQGLWTCFPDGTGHAIYWGNNTTSPGGVINARELPSGKVIAVLGSCHDRPWGALGIIDRMKGLDGRAPVLRTWPETYRRYIHAEGEDFDSSKKHVSLKYADPYPLDETHFIAVKMTGHGEETCLVYLDTFGNECPVHFEGPGVHSPILLRPSQARHVQPVRRSYEAPNAPGLFYLKNVYEGTHMAGVKPGTIKSIRIVESPEKRSYTHSRGWFGHGEEAPAMNWHSFENKRILGTVPVEEDGSAYFEVPGNTFVYFQALDRDGMMVQSMRSGTYVQPGETYGCVGCHENRLDSAQPGALRPRAMSRKPDKMNGWYGPARLFSFQKEVQPVFTKNCLACHDYGGKASEKLTLAGDRDIFFAASYVDLWSKGLVKLAGGGRAEIYPAYAWGSHASKLTKFLKDHGDVRLTPEERDRVITWMDINGVYYSTYDAAYPENYGGRCPLTGIEFAELERLTGRKIAYGNGNRQRSQVSFERPSCSRILEGLKGKPQYDAALALIRTGAARLKEKPRGDMDGFRPDAADAARWDRSRRRDQRECEIYKAIREKRVLFDGVE